MLKRVQVPDNVLDATAKIGVHPYHLTKAQVTQALADGKIEQDECDGLLWWLDNNGNMTDERVN
jgi:hypothetical protein